MMIENLNPGCSYAASAAPSRLAVDAVIQPCKLHTADDVDDPSSITVDEAEEQLRKTTCDLVKADACSP